ncbi:DUF6782 family putative metallopeptidase [Nitriliruptor alkaliphilus]|uniref:DUF6782 family putative metallopeptidase n=1 Tax=Nitriliruptor alkaliphilus TaxID=427918 RepID=UPI0006975C88|nr:DUF6782 family putative metallopeptidase [Nitriliruptor alkaliphilus]
MRRRWRDQAGQSTAEYVAIVVLLAGVVLGLVATTGIGRSIGETVHWAFCHIDVSGGDCGGEVVAADEPGAGGPGAHEPATGGPGAHEPAAGGPGTGGSEGDDPEGGTGPALEAEPTSDADDRGFFRRLTDWIRDLFGGGGDPEPSVDDQVRDLLGDSEIGREALALLDELGITPEYEPGGGSYFVPSQNRIVLDSNLTPEQLAAILVHEALHAERSNTGQSPDIDGPRDAYVDGMIAEETDAVVRQVQANQQIQARNPEVPDTVLQGVYERAYDEAVAALGDDATEAQRRAAGEAAAEQAIRDAFENGDVVASTTGDTYPDLYGGYWDDRHSR